MDPGDERIRRRRSGPAGAGPDRQIDRHPRPIAWISTEDGDGAENLAPFSAYNYVSSSPPVVTFSASRRDDRFEDTAENELATGEFAVNVATERLAERMDRTSAGLAPGESEFEFDDVGRAECEAIPAPRVAEAVATMECWLYEAVEVYDGLVVFGEARYRHLADEVTTDVRIDARKVDTVGRLGGPYYTDADRIELERRF